MTSMLFAACFWFAALSAVPPAVLFCVNLRRFRRPPAATKPIAVSVLIPARNEEANIRDAVARVLQSCNVDLELLVWDDASTDATGEIVEQITRTDGRVQLLRGSGLPPSWNGKQHACWQLAQAATQRLLVFLDADVRVEPDLLASMAQFQQRTGARLVSGFPRLLTATFLERLLLPLIHFVLLAFLPMRTMRKRLWPSAAAGCGQFLMVDRDAYFASGGHRAIRESMHDGLLLPRIFRQSRFKTDIADITELASVRMYHSAAGVWNGLAKNATEGIATPAKIVPLTLLLFFGQVVAPLLGLAGLASLPVLWWKGQPADTRQPHVTLLQCGAVAVVLTVTGWLPRLLGARRFHQPWRSALLHPVGITVLLILQWYALLRKLAGRPVGWRQRQYSSASGAEQIS